MTKAFLLTLKNTVDGFENYDNLVLQSVPENINHKLLNIIALIAMWDDEYDLSNEDAGDYDEAFIFRFFDKFLSNELVVIDRADNWISIDKIVTLNQEESNAVDVLSSKFSIKTRQISILKDLFDYFVEYQILEYEFEDGEIPTYLTELVDFMLDKIKNSHTEFDDNWIDDLNSLIA